MSNLCSTGKRVQMHAHHVGWMFAFDSMTCMACANTSASASLKPFIRPMLIWKRATYLSFYCHTQRDTHIEPTSACLAVAHVRCDSHV